jgi:LPS sulfotransferase NodH
MKSYIICTTQRSGSTMLCSLLKQTNLLGNPIEGLLYLEIHKDALGEKQKLLKDLTLTEGLEHTKKKLTTENGIFGIKIMASTLTKIYTEIDSNGSDQAVPAFELFSKYYNQPTYIFLRRKNKVKQAISHTYLRKTGVAHAINENQLLRIQTAKANTQITYEDVDIDLNRVFKDELIWKQFFIENEIQPIVINFEDLLSDKTNTLLKITSTLDIGETIHFDDINAKTKKLSTQSEQYFVNQYIKRINLKYSKEYLSLFDMEILSKDQY